MELHSVVTGSYRTNTYLICEAGKAIIIDPGEGSETVISALEKYGVVPDSVLITHGHFDHISSAADLRALGAKIIAPALDYSLVQAENFYKDDPGETVKPFDADMTVGDGDELNILNHSFKVMSTPGHTPGGVCYIMDNAAIFTGDTLFKLSVGRWDFPRGDGAALVKSLRKIFALPGDYEIFPGHGESTTLEFERKNNPYARI